MSVDYPGAIDMTITDPAWIFTDALTSIPATDLTIVLHKTACGQTCTATDIANSFKNDTVHHKSVHFIVGRDGSVIQVVLLKDGAGGNCCLENGHDPYWDRLQTTYNNLNTCTISIEHEDWTTDNSQTMTQEQIVASLALVTWLVRRYKLNPASQIKGHYTLDAISRARCPGPTYPLAQLIGELTMQNNPGPGMQQQAQDVWKSTTPMLNTCYGSGPVANSAIYRAWLQLFYTGRYDLGGPTTLEISTVDWANKPIKMQWFQGGYRAEYDQAGITHFLNPNNQEIYKI